MYKYRSSIIVPVYNTEKYVNEALYSLAEQTIAVHNKDVMEIIIVDNGSTDNSPEICRKFIKDNPDLNIKYLEEKKKGVSYARNTGILSAEGEYIFFLDSDDELSYNTVKEVCDFFDSVKDDVDMVTYRIDTMYNGRILPPHFRYKYLYKSGVYDLKTEAYIGQTTMNIAVKNNPEIFFDTGMSFNEDMKFCCDVLMDKLKIGFCENGRYIYNRRSDSSSAMLSGSCYIFEKSMSFFEQLFKKFEHEEVPKAFQGLYVHDIDWKLCSGILLPYHYIQDKFNGSVIRIKKLLDRCDTDLILKHPAINPFQRLYWVSEKKHQWCRMICSENKISIVSDYQLIYSTDSIEIVLSKIYVRNNRVFIRGYIKSPVFLFFSDSIELYIRVNNSENIKAELFPSDFGYIFKGERTQNFKGFSYEADCGIVNNISFLIKADGYEYTPQISFDVFTGLDRMTRRYECIKGNIKITFKDNQLIFSSSKSKTRHDIWIYYDCHTVEYDNGAIQFLHDCNMNDGIERYYIITYHGQAEYLSEHGISSKNMIKFGSAKHKNLLAKCSKIITSFIEPDNLFPYLPQDYHKYAAEWHFETVYLQHGVMHIDMPWKYSAERIIADRIVISANMEKQAFLKHNFRECDMIECTMPRISETDISAEPERKIIAAPSWREYLSGYDEHNNHKPLRERFESSLFFRKWLEFLNSPKLEEILEKYDMQLDFQLHPIFSCYEDMFQINNNRVSVITERKPCFSYSVMITDFSSYEFDFIYLKRSIIHFIPDNDEFRCGMNSYRRTLYTEENGFGPYAYTPSDLCKELEKLLSDGCICEKKYMDRMEKCFIASEGNPCEKIYRTLTADIDKYSHMV